MSDLFEEEVDLTEETFEDVESVDIEDSADITLDARRKLEKMLEEKRLREELDDFIDY